MNPNSLKLKILNKLIHQFLLDMRDFSYTIFLPQSDEVLSHFQRTQL